MSKPSTQPVTYDLVRFLSVWTAFSCSSSQYRAFSNDNTLRLTASEPRPPVNSCTTCTLGLPLAWLFLVMHLFIVVFAIYTLQFSTKKATESVRFFLLYEFVFFCYPRTTERRNARTTVQVSVRWAFFCSIVVAFTSSMKFGNFIGKSSSTSI